MAPALTAPTAVVAWSDDDVSVADVDRALARLRTQEEDVAGALRTSVMTHLAWIPERWTEAAARTLAGLAERHPSRTILLFPEPDAADGIDAEVSFLHFALEGLERTIATEVVRLRLRGARSRAPASIVAPLLVSDLPVFLRWRGEPPWGADELDQLLGVTDRLVVDSREWRHLPVAYGRLEALFERAAISDIAWQRTLPARRALAALWPGVASVRELRVRAPKAEALLLTGWLRSRLAREVRLAHEAADELERVAVDGDEVELAKERRTPSDLLSNELDCFGRDRMYEQAVRALAETVPGGAGS